MLIFVAAVAALLALLTYAIHRRLAVTPGWSPAVRRASAITLTLGWAAALAAFAMESGAIDPHRARWLAWAGMTWLALAWYLLLGVLVLGIACLAVRLARRPNSRRGILRVGTPIVVVGALAATGYGLFEAAEPRITHATVTNDQLPSAFDDLRVALVTDLHVGPVREESFTRRVVDQVNAQKPDLVILGGDLADGKVEQVGDSLAPLADLEAPLGVVAVTGNHEFISQEPVAWMDHWETLGIDVLRNEGVELTRGLATITVAGIHDETGTGTGAPDVDQALAGTERGRFTLLAAHQPLSAERAQGRGVDLQVSGHTHGGQLWPFRWAVLLQQPAIDGLTPVGDVPVLTSRGAGAWGPPVRVLAPPHVPIITLRQG